MADVTVWLKTLLMKFKSKKVRLLLISERNLDKIKGMKKQFFPAWID